jgi:hypothetical protein
MYQMLQNASTQVWKMYQMFQITSEYIFPLRGGRYGDPQKGLECLEVTPNMWSLQLHPEDIEQILTKNIIFCQVGYQTHMYLIKL